MKPTNADTTLSEDLDPNTDPNDELSEYEEELMEFDADDWFPSDEMTDWDTGLLDEEFDEE